MNVTKNHAIPVLLMGMLFFVFFAVTGMAKAQVSTTSTATTTSSGGTLPTCTISAEPTSIGTLGFSMLSWSATNADTLVITPEVGTSTFTNSGSRTVFPTTTTTYRGTASGPNGTSTCQVTVAVGSTATSTSTSTPATTTTSTSTQNNTNNSTTTNTTNIQTTGTTSANGIPRGNNLSGTTSTSTLTNELNRLRGVLNTLTQGRGTTTPGSSQNGGTPSQSPQQSAPRYPTAGSTPAPMILEMSANGRVLIRGTVTDVSDNSLTITSWGGSWTIRTDTRSRVIPRGTGGAGDLSAINEGDFIGANGTIATDRAFTVDATFVRDWTTNPYVAPAAGTTSPSTGTTTPPSNNGSGTNRNGMNTPTSTPTPRTSPTPSSGGAATSTGNRATPTATSTPRATTTGTSTATSTNGNGGGGFLRDLFNI